MDEADRLEVKAASISSQAKDANKRANDYMFAVVLFASSLFFAGISLKLPTTRAQAAMLGLGWLVFTGTVIWLATLPAQLNI